MNTKNTVLALGAVLCIVGIIGYFSRPVLGIFAVNGAHNFVHLISGILAVAFVRRGEESARRFARIFGFVYGLVAVLGLVIPGDMVLGFMPVNFADDLLHALVAAVFIYVGYREGS